MPKVETVPDSDDIGRLFEDIKFKLKSLQVKLTGAAGMMGFAIETVDESQRLWLSFSQGFLAAPTNKPYLSSTVEVLCAFSNELDAAMGDMAILGNRLDAVASTGSAIASGTNAFASLAGMPSGSYSGTVVFSPLDKFSLHNEYRLKLGRLDPELGIVYEELIDSFYGRSSDSSRSAMFMARQLFDHFFDVLAPDIKVRESRYWRPKSPQESKDPKAVWRSEKLEFVALDRIQDPFRSQTLLSVSKQVIELHDLLNKAHT